MIDTTFTPDQKTLPNEAQPDCLHDVVWSHVSEQDPTIRIWACGNCQRRFYPACPICVDNGHRRADRHAGEEIVS